MNQFFVIGKIMEIPEIERSKNGWKRCDLNLQVQRPFPNAQGQYEFDQIVVQLWRGAAETLVATGQIDGWMSARGRIQTNIVEKEGRTYHNYSLIAENVEYLH